MMTNLFFIIFGIVFADLALSIIIRHKEIWNCSLQHYNASDSKFLDILRRPNKFSYYLNLLLIWPLVALISFVCIYIRFDQGF